MDVYEVLDELIDNTPENVPDRVKLERVRDRMDEGDIAVFLRDRGKLPKELEKQYNLDQLGSNVGASEIPEEAPEYTGDVGTAELAGMAPPLAPPQEAPVDEIDDYNDLKIADLKATIEARNADRAEEDLIEMPTGNAKAPYVAALEADDERYSEE
jgi:hypothetical protein